MSPLRLLLLAAASLVALAAPRAAASDPAISDVDAFLEQCPDSDPIYSQLVSDFQVRRNGVVVPPPPCRAPISKLPIAEYTDALAALQTFRVAYYLDGRRPGRLPWTTQTFYDWMKSRIAGINFKDGVVGGYCCDLFDGRRFIVAGPQDELNRDFDRKWEGIWGNLTFYAHETRHTDPGAPGHTSCCRVGVGACDDAYDESNLGAYAVQRWMHGALYSGTLDVGLACLAPERGYALAEYHRASANYSLERFCTSGPPFLGRAEYPGGSCANGEGLVVPVVLSSQGSGGSFYSSELVLTNEGPSAAPLSYAYSAAFGGDGGTASDTLAAGEQKVVPDAIDYLRGLGVPLGETGNRGGPLRVRFLGPVSATVRTTTVVPSGRAGLSYAGLRSQKLLHSFPVYLCGLRENGADRSNVAVVHAGVEADGPVTLSLAVTPGESPRETVLLPEITLPPGGFAQVSRILSSNGLSFRSGYVRVARVRGTAPFYAYGVINDERNSDGSFVEPVNLYPAFAVPLLTLPVVVETAAFSSELVLTNVDYLPHTLRFLYVAEALARGRVEFELTLPPKDQWIVPDFLQFLRASGMLDDPRGRSFAGALFVTDATGDLRQVSVAARTTTPGGGGRYGVFYTAVPTGAEAQTSASLHGLRQDAQNRTNLALVNVGSTDGSTDTFRIELFDGDAGVKAATIEGIAVPARGFLQIDAILSRHAPTVRNGYALVTRTAGHNPFLAFAVVNDGAAPGERSGDGAFVRMVGR